MNNNDKTQCATDEACATKKCCPVKCLITAVAVFVVIFVFEFFFHSQFMMPYYKATASLWRPEADMKNFLYINLIRQVGTALVFTCLYGWFSKLSADCNECPVKKGAKFGFKIGLLLGLAAFGSYFWLPLPSLDIPVMWLVGNTIMGVLMGIAAGLCCRMGKKKASN